MLTLPLFTRGDGAGASEFGLGLDAAFHSALRMANGQSNG
jgi:hypothetical protein